MRIGGLPVDEYMDKDKPADVTNGAGDWDYENDDDHDTEHQVTEVNYYSYDQIRDDHVTAPAPLTTDWAQEEADPWGSSSPVQETGVEEYSGEMATAICLYTFDATSNDELSVKEGEWVNLLLSACEEDGWVMGQNSDNQTGLIPASFVSQMTPEEYEAQLAAAADPAGDNTNNDTSPWPDSAPAADPWPQSSPAAAPWPDTAPAAPPLSVPSCPPPMEEEETSSEEESEDESDGGPPPGLAPPPGPPPSLSPPGLPPCPPPQTPASPAAPLMGTYLAIYDFQSSADDELTLSVGDVVVVKRPGDDEGWFFGSLNGREGIFPSAYVEPYKPPSEEKKDKLPEMILDANENSSSENEEDSEEEEDSKSIEAPVTSTAPPPLPDKPLETVEEVTKPKGDEEAKPNIEEKTKPKVQEVKKEEAVSKSDASNLESVKDSLDLKEGKAIENKEETDSEEDIGDSEDEAVDLKSDKEVNKDKQKSSPPKKERKNSSSEDSSATESDDDEHDDEKDGDLR